MYIPFDEIKTIQIDHTSRCNLLCPQCARTEGDKVNSAMPINDLTVDDYKMIFEPFIGKDLGILHCGNYGDVIASPTFDDTLDWCLQNNFNKMRIITNGSARNTAWWKELGKKNIFQVVFSIDGLEDTNHLYRVNSNFNKIIENVKAFIEAGGNARWDYLVFEHNKHQVEQAMELAKKIGVQTFNTKNTTRFINSYGYKNTVQNKKTEIVKDRTDNPILKDYAAVVKSYGSFEKYVRNTEIVCKYKQEKMIYVDFETRVWPCCWVGAPIHFQGENDVQKIDIKKILNKFGNDFNKLSIHGWDKVLEHEFYDNYLEKTWEDSTDRIYTCGRTCGTGYESSSGYGANTKMKKL
jgi:MoaA/NifB/PqqE/SkfB family radical SAM enzyme